LSQAGREAGSTKGVPITGAGAIVRDLTAGTSGAKCVTVIIDAASAGSDVDVDFVALSGKGSQPYSIPCPMTTAANHTNIANGSQLREWTTLGSGTSPDGSLKRRLGSKVTAIDSGYQPILFVESLR